MKHNPLAEPCLSSSNRDFEVFLDTVDVLAVHQGVVGGLVVDKLAGVGRGPVLVPVDGQGPRATCIVITV